MPFDTDAVLSCRVSWAALSQDQHPVARVSHSSVDIGESRVWLFGGGTDCVCAKALRRANTLSLTRAGEWRSPTEEWTHYGDVHVFDTRSGAWNEWTLPGDAPAPSARRGHAAAYVASIRTVFVFGGTCGDTQNEQCMRDSWAYQVPLCHFIP